MEELLSPEEVDKMLLRDILGESLNNQSQSTKEQDERKKKELEMAARLSDTTDREEAISLAMQLFPNMTRERAAKITDEALKMYKKGGG